ncbi:MAG: class I SAM-dependent methyltransferase [Acidimicrobiales bacterium]
MNEWALHCVTCRAALGIAATLNSATITGTASNHVTSNRVTSNRAGGPADATCEQCGAGYPGNGGIWSMLRAEDRPRVDRFLVDYTHIRQAEGRGSQDPEYYRALPATAPDDPLAWQWAIRARSWAHAHQRLFGRHYRGRAPGPLRVVDVGAGVGWLSNQLAAAGHAAIAVDLSLDGLDGLSAAGHYRSHFAVVQAHFDHLPLASGQADMVLFNASFHYSVDYAVTVAEALRVLAPGGRLVVLDSPIYRHDHSGRQMVLERHADFEARFGTRSDSVPSKQYLTPSVLDELAERFGLQWQRSRAYYGWRWAARPLVARVRRRREPSRFELLVAAT